MSKAKLSNDLHPNALSAKNQPLAEKRIEILEPMSGATVNRAAAGPIRGQAYIRRDPETGEAIGFLFEVCELDE